MIAFLLRRDRFTLPAWILGLGLFVVYIGTALPAIAPTRADLLSVAGLFAQPVGRMFTGPGYGMEDPTYERFFATGYAPYLYLLAALMNILLVTRHTRAEEQSGRAELLRANGTGRYTALTSCLILALGANAAVGVVVAAMGIAVGFAAPGSVLVGGATAVTGMAFAGLSAATAQVSEYSRSAAGLAGVVLGAGFALRAVGDMTAAGGSALSWASPLGWAAQTAPYVLDRFWPLLFNIALAVAGIAAAYLLQSRRDFGAGLLPPRRGRAHASGSLGTPIGLAARIQRSAALGWAGAILALGVVDGAFTGALLEAGRNMPPALREVFGEGDLVDGYAAFLAAFAAVLAIAYSLPAMLTLRGEEVSGRAELVLAAPVSRVAWLASHTAVIAAAVGLITLVTGLGTGIAAALVTGAKGAVATAVGAHLCLLPGSLVMVGVWAALFGWFPRLLAAAGWAWVAVIAAVAFFGDLLDLPGGLTALSPLAHLARVPQEGFAPGPALALTLAGVALVALGLVGVRAREVRAG